MPDVETKQMSRGAQTAWIVGMLAALGLGGLYFATRMDPMERNAECQTMFGMDDECVISNARARLNGGIDPVRLEAAEAEAARIDREMQEASEILDD